MYEFWVAFPPLPCRKDSAVICAPSVALPVHVLVPSCLEAELHDTRKLLFAWSQARYYLFN